MRAEVEVAAVCDALELRPADRVQVLDVARRGRVVGELARLVLADAEVALADAEPRVPAHALLHPVAEPLVSLAGRDEELHLHLLELERAEDEVAGRDLVAERLPDLGDAEGGLATGELGDVLEVDEDPLRRLRAEVGVHPRLLERPDPRLEHEVEVARLGEVALVVLARVLARLRAALHLVEVVGAEAELAEACSRRAGREAARRDPTPPRRAD